MRRKKPGKIVKQRKDIDRKKSENKREMVFDLVGGGAGICTGLVIDAGLKMIPFDEENKVKQLGFQAGRWILSSIVGKLVQETVTKEVKEKTEVYLEVLDTMKSLSVEGNVPAIDGESEQTYETDE